MGFFKDLRDVKRQADAMPRASMGDMLSQAKEGMAMASDAMAAQQQAASGVATGTEGQATISAIRDTGMTINENPVVEFDLQVIGPGGSPYPVTHRQMIPRLQIPQLQPGATVRVMIDPNDPNKLNLA